MKPFQLTASKLLAPLLVTALIGACAAGSEGDGSAADSVDGTTDAATSDSSKGDAKADARDSATSTSSSTTPPADASDSGSADESTAPGDNETAPVGDDAGEDAAEDAPPDVAEGPDADDASIPDAGQPDTSTPPADTGAPSTTPACDPNNAAYGIAWIAIEFTPAKKLCSKGCASNECCYTAGSEMVCLGK